MVTVRGVTAQYWFFFFNDPATTEIYTLPLHYALPIFQRDVLGPLDLTMSGLAAREVEVLRLFAEGLDTGEVAARPDIRSEEHTSELQSRLHLVCRLLLEKKKKGIDVITSSLHEALTDV